MGEEDKKRVKLVRMPDGSIRPATDIDSDIGDVWAKQQFIREQEAKEDLLLRQQPKEKQRKRLFKKAKKKVAAPTPAAPTAPSPAMPHSLHRASYRGQRIPGLQPEKSVPATKEIAISLTIPKIKAPKVTKKHVKKATKKLKTTPKWAYATMLLLLLPALMLALGVAARHTFTKKSGVVEGAQAVAVPDYQTLAPNGDVTDTTSQKITYDASKKVSSFTDKISGYEVTVSMQPIPDTFKPGVADNVKKVAEQFSANTVLSVNDGAAYLGTSAKGPQSFVGYRGDLLVFMTSQQKIADKAWADYFNSLK